MYAYAYSYCSVINLFREIVLQKFLCEPSCFTLPVMLARKVLSRQCLVVTRLCPGIIASSFRLYSSRGVTRPAWINSCKYSSRSMTSSALFDSPNCPSCGVVLQTEHPDKDGYCLLPKGGKKAKNNQDALKEKLLLSVKKKNLQTDWDMRWTLIHLLYPKKCTKSPVQRNDWSARDASNRKTTLCSTIPFVKKILCTRSWTRSLQTPISSMFYLLLISLLASARNW